nr:MAG TPA: hypothetical protein [Caudoviricetes sp.]
MKKLSEYKDEEALDILADLIEPVSAIFADEEIREIVSKNKGTKAKAISIAIKRHKKEVISILATLDGVSVEEYHCSVLSLPVKLLEILNDKELTTFLALQSQNMEEQSSGSVMENISEKA